MIEYVKADLLVAIKSMDGIRICPHVCNDIGGFGSGFAGAIVKVFPEVRDAYKKWHADNDSFELGKIQIVPTNQDSNILFVNMIAQHKTITVAPGSTPIRYVALVECMTELAERISRGVLPAWGTSPKILAPKFGAGLAGGNWEFIETLIEECWSSQGIPVTIYEWP